MTMIEGLRRTRRGVKNASNQYTSMVLLQGDEMDALAAAAFCGALAFFCGRRGLDVAAVWLQLRRRGAPTLDREWCAASEARAMALYLVNQIGAAPIYSLARAVGLTPAAVWIAVQRIEERRDVDAGLDADLRAVAYTITGREFD